MEKIKEYFEKQVLEFLKKYKIKKTEKLLVASSGGCDSLSLLFCLKNLGYKIIAIHVNHNLREESKFEEEYLIELFKKEKIGYKIFTWHGKVEKNLEQEARDFRYKSFCEASKEFNINKICLAHHANDQVETFLMNISRGSSIDGLASIPEYYKKNDIFILRPLLNLKKEDCKNYLNNLNIKWVEDNSNEDIKFKRNKLRKILNELEKPDLIDSRILKTVETLQDIKKIVDKILIKNYKKSIIENENKILLNLKKFNKMINYEKIDLLNKIILRLSNSEHKVRKEQLENIINDFKDNKSKIKRTILNIKIESNINFVEFKKT